MAWFLIRLLAELRPLTNSRLSRAFRIPMSLGNRLKAVEFGFGSGPLLSNSGKLPHPNYQYLPKRCLSALCMAWLPTRAAVFSSRCLQSNQVGSIMFRSLRAYMDMVVEKGIQTTESTKQWKIREQSYPAAFPAIL